MMPLPGAVVYAKDLASVAGFYREVAALSVESEHDDHVVLRGPHVQLVVVSIPAVIADTIVVADPPVRRSDTAVKLVFPVPSIPMARAAAQRLGGVVDPVAREWSFEGVLVCDGHDPEGNVIQVRHADPPDVED